MSRLHLRLPRQRSARAGLLLLAASVGMVAWGLFAPSTANAVCTPGVSNGTDPPIPQRPGTGIWSFIDQPPKDIPPAGAEDEVFKPGSRYTIEQVYGFGGIHWNTYDLGCGGDLANPIDAGQNAVANFMMLFPTAMVSMTGALLDSAFHPGFMKVFDPMVATVITGMRDSVFLGWLPIAGMALASLLIVRARKNALSDTLGAAMGAGAVLLASAVLFQLPLVLGHVADDTVTGINGAIVGGINGKAQGGALDAASEIEADLHRSLLYEPWMGGELGRSHGAIAEKYGADLFKSQTFSWREQAIADADPTGAAGAKIEDEKNTLWDATTQHIKDEDPDAYQYLTGHYSNMRMGYAFLSMVGVGVAVPFLLFSGLLVIVALIIVRFASMVFPGLAPIAMLPNTRYLATGLAKTVVAAILNCSVFVMGASLLARAFGFLLDPAADLNGLLQMFLMLALTVVMWRVLHPFRKLTAMVGKRNHFAEAASTPADLTKATGRMVWKLGKAAATAYFTGRVAGAAAADSIGGEVGDRAETTVTATMHDLPPRPSAPTYRPAIGTGPVEGTPYKTAGDLPQHPGGVGGYTPPPGPGTPVVPVQDNDGQDVYTIFTPDPMVWQGPGQNGGDVYDARTARAHGVSRDSGALPNPTTTDSAAAQSARLWPAAPLALEAAQPSAEDAAHPWDASRGDDEW